MRKLWVPSRSIVMPRPWFRQRGFFVPMAAFHSRKVGAADFDGTNDYMTRGAGLTGAADGKTGILSAWYRIDGGDGTSMRVLASFTTVGGSLAEIGSIRFSRNTGNSFQLVGLDSSTVRLLISSTTGRVADSSWHHLLASWDTSAGPSACRIYIDDANVTSGIPTADNNNLSYSTGQLDWGVAGNGDGGNKWNGAWAEFYFAPNQYLDITVEANRRKFITADGKPAYLGNDGSRPTGSAPLLYLRLRKNEAVANFATNRGTGGNFSITGTLDYASSSPSD